MKKAKLLLIFLLSAFVGFLSFPAKKKEQQKTVPVQKDSLVTVRISVTGDIMCHSTQFNYARVSKDSFDFKPVFDSVKNFFAFSDFVAGNLETVIADTDKNYAGYPVFNTPPDFLEGLKYAGFNHLILANNHILDRGVKGLLGTIKRVKEFGFSFGGAVENPERKDSVRIFNIKGIKIAFLSFTYFTNNTDKAARKYVSLIKNSELQKKIKLARKKGADIVALYFHFGKEYERTPNAEQIRIVKNAVRYGADVIFASHTHTVQPAAFVKRSENDSVFVIYSMGNFLSNQRWRYSDGGVIINVDVTKNFTKDFVYISNYSYLPVWVFKGKIDGKRRYLIYPLGKKRLKELPPFFSRQDSLAATTSFFDTDSIINSFGAKLRREEWKN